MNRRLRFLSHGSNCNVTCITILSGGSEIALYDQWYIIIFHTLACQASVKSNKTSKSSQRLKKKQCNIQE